MVFLYDLGYRKIARSASAIAIGVVDLVFGTPPFARVGLGRSTIYFGPRGHRSQRTPVSFPNAGTNPFHGSYLVFRKSENQKMEHRFYLDIKPFYRAPRVYTFKI